MRYSSIRKFDISNGEGIGISLFVQGCPFRCYNCFNPDTWDFNGGNEWTEKIENDFLNLLKDEHIKRVTILGGEPLAEQNLSGVLGLIEKIRKNFPDKIIWLYTGFVFEECIKHPLREKILSYCDVLIDGPYIDSLRDISLAWRGSSNQRVIDVQKSLLAKKVSLRNA